MDKETENEISRAFIMGAVIEPAPFFIERVRRNIMKGMTVDAAYAAEAETVKKSGYVPMRQGLAETILYGHMLRPEESAQCKQDFI